MKPFLDRTFRVLSPPNRLVGGAILLAVGARTVFWIVTQRVGEDALITVTHARSVTEGLGLTHHAGEPVTHGFTSALSVLIPLLGEVVVRGSGILVLQAVSVIAAALTIVVANRLCQRLGIGPWPTLFVLAYLALDQNHIFYGMAGMETQLAVLILLWSIDALMGAGPRRIGLSLGLALLVRPDFLLWIGTAGLDLIVRYRRRALEAFAVFAIVVGPWLIFTTLYYGSPIPNTILAKATRYVTVQADALPALLAWFSDALPARILAVLRTFMPFYEDTLVTGAPLPLGVGFFISATIWAFAVIGVVRTWRIPGWRAAIGFAGLFLAYRLVVLPGTYFDWYVPPHTAVLILLAGAGVAGLQPLRRFDLRPAVAIAIAILFALPFPFTLGLERKLQTDLEDAVRRTVGVELGNLMAPGEILVTESAGYYGYYSHATLYDFPGLTSKVARRTLEELPANARGIQDMVSVLQPDWMALRPDEWLGIEVYYPTVAARYDIVETVTSPSGSIEFDDEDRPRISFGGYVKDASAWKVLILHRVR